MRVCLLLFFIQAIAKKIKLTEKKTFKQKNILVYKKVYTKLNMLQIITVLHDTQKEMPKNAWSRINFLSDIENSELRQQFWTIIKI